MNILKNDFIGRKTNLFFFLILLLFPFFAVGQERKKEYFKIDQEENKIILELSSTLIGREWLLVNQIVSSDVRNRIQAGDMYGDPQILQLKECENGEVSLICKAVMSKNAGSNMTGKPKSPHEIARFSMEKQAKDNILRLDITSWVKRDSGMVEGKLQEKTLKTYSHPDGVEIVGWRQRKDGNAQVSSCLFLMSKDLMRLRYEDKRVGYFKSKHLNCSDTSAVEDTTYCISRWRLEPRVGDVKKYRRDILVEPVEPIIFYIDPLTPTKWIPYIETAINNWAPVFERAGFKNAIRAQIAPQGDSTWTLESCRAAIIYRPSTEENAFGERYADPRSGQIYHARIMWGHSLVEWLKGNYILQAGLSDPRVFEEGISDEWLGTLLSVIVSHEVGHTLGLTHNFGASSVIPVEKLRDNSWLTEHGISTSIMDYSRFNYVAQPGDQIDRLNLIPRINVYDEWAIEWGYRLFPKMKTLKEEHAYILRWTAAQQENWGYWFGSERSLGDPRAQSEDLGDDLVTANTYGIQNLKRVLTIMENWKPDQEGSFSTYQKMYDRIVTIVDRNVPIGQYYYYIRQFVNVIGGRYVDYDATEQEIAKLVDSLYQHRAMAFLGENIFTTPEWLLKPLLDGKVDREPLEFMEILQTGALALLLPKASSLQKDSTGGYQLNDFFRDLTEIIWQVDVLSGKMPDVYRQNLQKGFLQRVSAYAMSGGPQGVKLYKTYVSGLKKEVEKILENNRDEAFDIYCRDMLRIMNRFLK